MPNEARWIASFLGSARSQEAQGLSDLQALQLREDVRLMPLQRGDRAFLEALPQLGSADYTTENACVSCTRREQVQGVLTLNGETALFGGAGGMRWLNASWRHSVAVLSRGDDFRNTPPCLLLFGEAGELAHHVAIPDPSAWEAFLDLVCRHRGCWTCLQHGAPRPEAVPPGECPGWLLREAWREAGSDRDLDLRLQKLGLTRLLALRTMEGLHTSPLHPQDLSNFLDQLAAARLPTQVRLGNRHCLQVLEAPVERLEARPRAWELQMGPTTLRLDPSALDSVWLVTPPWTQGERPQIECYGRDGEPVLTLACPASPSPLAQVGWQRALGRLEARSAGRDAARPGTLPTPVRGGQRLDS